MEQQTFTLDHIKRAVLIGYHACQYELAMHFQRDLDGIETAMNLTLEDPEGVENLIMGVLSDGAHNTVPVVSVELGSIVNEGELDG